MTDNAYQPWDEKPQWRRETLSALGAVLLLLVAGLVLVVVVFPPVRSEQTGVPVSRKLSELNYPAVVTRTVGQPLGGTWLLPGSVAVAGGATFVLDSGNNRIVEVDAEGRMARLIGGEGGNGPQFSQPMALATDGSRLLVANALAGEVVILNREMTIERVIKLEAPPAGRPPRPIGVAVSGSGRIIVSDADNHRVLIMGSDGEVLHTFGTGTRAGGPDGLNVPAGLATDKDGYIYVVDMLNGRVVKLTQDGQYVRDFASLADTAGSLARPKSVAVDEAGRIFVSDGLQAAIEVFGPDGGYLGVIGRRDVEDPAAGSVFEAPSGLWLEGERLLVADAVAGLIELELGEPGASTEED
jgi:DNA-binding beta-propeller fold protein YncE